ncbi:1717_t:CDS:2 [Entrophospora sp. SA101]|nr:1717_t:CDS:2 [Entrophospora sp. SA101]
MPANKTTNKTRNSIPGLVSAEDAKSTLILTGGESSSNNGKLAMTIEKDGLLSTMRDLEIAPLMKPKNTSTTWIGMLKIQADKRKIWIRGIEDETYINYLAKNATFFDMLF